MQYSKVLPLAAVSRNLFAHNNITSVVRRSMTSLKFSENEAPDHFKTLQVTSPSSFVYHVELNRPKRLNAMNNQMWIEFRSCFNALANNPDCRAIVLSGSGTHFCAGIDLADMMVLGQQLAAVEDVARKAAILERLIKLYQESFSAIELCKKPVIAAVHSACIGAGVDMITAADIRYCTQDAFFQVKEVDIGMAPDVGTLQRLPKVIGNQSLVRELCYTGRRFDSAEAHGCGLIGKVFQDKEHLLRGALELAATIAEKSPVAVQGTKANIVYSESRPTQDGLDHIREINKLHLQSEDFPNAVSAQLTKGDKPTFSKL